MDKLNVTGFRQYNDSDGSAYEITWAELCEKLGKHVVGPKDGTLFALTNFKDNHRSNEDVISISGLILDVERRSEAVSAKTGKVIRPAGPVPPPMQVTLDRARALGLQCVLYTSHSHTEALPRYRVVAALDRTVDVEELRSAGERDTYQAFADLLGLEHVSDTGKWLASAQFYLPRAPADRIGISRAEVLDGAPADAGRFLAEARIIGERREAERRKIEEEVFRRDGAKTTRKKPGKDTTLIAKLRDAMPPMRVVLATHGYAYDWRSKKFLSPHSDSGIPGVAILTGLDGVERMVSHHYSDELNCSNIVFGSKAHDVVDVEIAETYGTTDDARRRGLHELAKQHGITDDVSDGWDMDEPEAAEQPGAEGAGDGAEGAAGGDGSGGDGSAKADEDPEDAASQLADLEILASKVPSIDPRAFYGPLAEIVEAATAQSEATRVGVASHLLTSFSCIAARPFFVQLSDERLGLNLFTLQVGQSAKGRKGTSEAFSKRHLIPGFISRTELMAENIREQARAASAAQRAAEQAKAKVDALTMRIERLPTLTPEAIEAAIADLPSLEQVMAGQKAYRSSYIDRLKDTVKPLSPASVDKYEDAIQAANVKIAALTKKIDALKLADAEMRADYAGRETLGGVLGAELAQAEHNHAEAARRASAMSGAGAGQDRRWLELFMVMSERPNVLTGIASGAGIVDKIRDPATILVNAKEVEIPGVDDKRLLINLSEFGSVLSAVQSGRQVSEVWRQMWDCAPLDLGAKTTPTSCQEPFVCVSGSITPAELSGLLFDDPKDKARSADNGFANRHLFLFVNREKLVSDPKPTEGADRLIGVLFQNVLRVYAELQPRGTHLSTEYKFSGDGLARWNSIYEEIDRLEGASANASKLFGRMTTNVRKLAPILAMLNGEATVGAAAVDAAWAWVRYSADTINAIAASAQERKSTLKMSADVGLVIAALRKEGADQGVCVRLRDVVIRSKLPVKQVTAAITVMERKSPPWVEVVPEWVTGGNGARREVTTFLLTKWVPD